MSCQVQSPLLALYFHVVIFVSIFLIVSVFMYLATEISCTLACTRVHPHELFHILQCKNLQPKWTYLGLYLMKRHTMVQYIEVLENLYTVVCGVI